MGIKFRKKQISLQGFTIIEVMIVLAIASLIMLIVFMAVTQLRKTTRDAERKQYARTVLTALEDYQSNNLGNQTNCFGGSTSEDCAVAAQQASRFITAYMSSEVDPATGNDYRADTTDNVSTQYCNGVATPSESTVYCWNDRVGSYVRHDVVPDVGQLYIIPVHLCGTSSSDPNDVGTFGDQSIRDSSGATNGGNPRFSVSVLIGTETGEFYCVNS